MSYELERRLIETAFMAGMPAGFPIEYENVDFIAPLPGTGGSYVRITIRSAGEGRFTGITSTSATRHPGIIDVAIFTPPGAGTVATRAIADRVTQALSTRTLAKFTTTVRTFMPRVDFIGRMGDWFQANVTIRFERETAPSDFSDSDFSEDFQIAGAPAAENFSAIEFTATDFKA